MVNKFGNGTGNDVTNQRKRYETTNINFVVSWSVRRFVTEHKARGFTLLELLVSIGIFAVITTAVVVNFRSGQHANELRLAAEGLASDLRSRYTTAQAGTATSFAVGTLVLTLPATINVQEIQPSNLTTVKFEPPEPRIQIYNANNQELLSDVQITLQHTKTNQTKTIVIRRISGRITVE